MTKNNKTKKTEVQLTPYQKAQSEASKKIIEYKKTAEAAVTSLIYKNSDKLTECDLTLDDFSNNIFKVYFAVATELVKEKMDLTDVNCGVYLSKHKRLESKWNEYGGFQTMLDAGEYLKESSFNGYVDEVKKWNAVLQLLKYGFPVSERLSEYADMSAEQIYEETEGLLNHIFSNVDTKIKSYDALTDLHSLVDKLNAGEEVGMPITAELLNQEIGGLRLGNIYSLTAASGAGKSTILINYILPQCIKYNRKCVIFINEEDIAKVRKELLVWCATNILKKPIKKVQLRDGNFDKETLETLHEAANWLEEKNNDHTITVIPLEHYNANTVIKLIKKYKRLFGVDLFILDTFKESSNSNKEAWKSMLDDSVALYDCIKPASLNVTLVMSIQIAKTAMRTRHLSNMDIGQSKSVVDVFSVSILCRRVEPDEYSGEKHELKCWKKHNKSKIPVKLDPEKYYLLFFIGKNRFGITDQYCIVSEVDLSDNTFKDIGYTVVPNDAW